MFKSLEEIKNAIKLLKEQQGNLDVKNLKDAITARANFLKMGILVNADLLKRADNEILDIVGHTIKTRNQQVKDDIMEIQQTLKEEIENELNKTKTPFNPEKLNLRLKKKPENIEPLDKEEPKSNNVIKIKKIEKNETEQEIENNEEIKKEEKNDNDDTKKLEENNDQKINDDEKQNDVINDDKKEIMDEKKSPMTNQ